MTLCVASLVFILTIWLLLSVLNQFGRSRFRGLRPADPLQLLPLWTFFAPNPGVHDYYLLYRDKSDGEPGTWQLAQPTQSRRWTSCLWNPDKVQNKVLSDLVQILAGYHDPPKDHGPAVMLTLPYLICLTMAISAAPLSPGAFRQFVLARKRGLVTTDELLPILISDFHHI